MGADKASAHIRADDIRQLFATKSAKRRIMAIMLSNGTEDEEVEMIAINPQEPKRGVFSETNLKLITAVIALIAGVAGFFNQHPKLYWFFIACAALVLILLLWSWLYPKAKERIALSHDREFVRAEVPRLQRLFARFFIFAASDDTRSFKYILGNLSNYRIEAVGRMVESDYIGTWIGFYQNHLAMQPRSLREFLSLSAEFTSIVTEFNKNHVIKAQQSLDKVQVPEQAAAWIEELEKFREEFSHLLRDVEEWAHSVNEVAASRLPDFYRFVQAAPTQIFARPSSFRPKTPVQQK